MPDRWLDMDTLPFPMYHLLDLQKHADYEDGLSFETSRGCFFRCRFCYVEGFHKRKWRGKGVEKVLGDLERVKKEIGTKKLFIIDDNFFGDRTRSFKICSAMKSRDLHFKWSATARADFLSKCSEPEMDKLKESGCEVLAIGAESGSRNILIKIEKGITPEQTEAAVKKCLSHGIMPTVSFIVGLPFETDEDLIKTIDLYDRLIASGRDVEVNGLFIYVPYAGTPLFDTAVAYGYQPKKTLEAWRDWNFSDSRNNPWITGKKRKMIEALSSIARYKYFRHRFDSYSEEFKAQKLGSPLLKLGFTLFVVVFDKIADWRWKRRFFDMAYEWTLWQKLTFRVFKVR